MDCFPTILFIYYYYIFIQALLLLKEKSDAIHVNFNYSKFTYNIFVGRLLNQSITPFISDVPVRIGKIMFSEQ